MKKYLLAGLSVLLLFFITSHAGIINAGLEETTYRTVAETTNSDNFIQLTEPTTIILLSTGVIGFLRISRSKLKK